MSQALERQPSNESSEDWTEWEVIDVRSQSCSVSSPKLAGRGVSSLTDASSGSLVNIGVAASQLVPFDAEEKTGEVDLHEAYRAQQLRMQQEKIRLQKATEEYQRAYGADEQTKKELASITAQQRKDREELASTQAKYDQVVQLTKDLERQLNEMRFQQRQVEQDRRQADREKALQNERNLIKQRALEEELQRQRALLDEKERRERQRQIEEEERRRAVQPAVAQPVAQPVSQPAQATLAVYAAPPAETWTCQKCGHDNDESFRYCPQCRAPNSVVAGLSGLVDPARCLEVIGRLGEDGHMLPGKSRDAGWVMKNKSKSPLALSARLQRISEDTRITVDQEGKQMDFHVAPGEELFVMVHMTAPPHPGRYVCFWQLIDIEGRAVGPPLEMILVVKREFSQKKEAAIKTIMNMGFNDRKKVVTILNANKWNVPSATEVLLEMGDN